MILPIQSAEILIFSALISIGKSKLKNSRYSNAFSNSFLYLSFVIVVFIFGDTILSNLFFNIFKNLSKLILSFKDISKISASLKIFLSIFLFFNISILFKRIIVFLSIKSIIFLSKGRRDYHAK